MIIHAVAFLALSNHPIMATATATCERPWSPGGAYSEGSLVSAVVTSSLGTTTRNFKCNPSGTMPNVSHCPNYDPADSSQSAAAWTDLGRCTWSEYSTVAYPPTLPIWAEGGCPDVWASGKSYKGGDVVSIILYMQSFVCNGVQLSGSLPRFGIRDGWTD